MADQEGKRLWIRSPNNTWIEVPYGAGQDDYLRSLNIWDGKKWMTPTWGWSERNRGINQPIPSLEVRKPGVTWIGPQAKGGTEPFYNPNSRHRTGLTPFVDFDAGWLRLFHLRPRTAAGWRIVPLIFPIPVRPPNVTLNYDTGSGLDIRSFWPSIGVYNLATSNLQADPVVENTSFFTGYAIPTNGALNTTEHSTDQTANTDAPGGISENAHRISAMIDLAAIRQRLEDTFPQQGIDFTGQHEPIQDMFLKRVIIHGNVTANIFTVGSNAGPQIDATTFRVYAQTNLPGVTENITDLKWDQEQLPAQPRPVRRPVNAIASGSVVWEKESSAMPTTVFGPNPDPNNPQSSLYYHVKSYLDNDFTYTLEGPGENSITLFSDIVNWPIAAHQVRSASAFTSLNIARISLQYGLPGVDVPAAMRTWDALQ